LKTGFQPGLQNVEVLLQKKDCLRGGGLNGCQWFSLKDVYEASAFRLRELPGHAAMLSDNGRAK